MIKLADFCHPDFLHHPLILILAYEELSSHLYQLICQTGQNGQRNITNKVWSGDSEYLAADFDFLMDYSTVAMTLDFHCRTFDRAIAIDQFDRIFNNALR